MTTQTKILIAIIILLVASASFLLGKISTTNSGGEGEVEILIPELTSAKSFEFNFPYVASGKGEVYYPINCKSVSRIQETNRIYFMTREEAEESGRTVSLSCL